MAGRPHEEAVFERSLRDPSCMAGRHGEFGAPVVVGHLGKRGLGGEPGWGCCVCLGDSLPATPHSVPLSSWQQSPLPCCTQGHACEHFYPPSDFTVSTQVFRDMKSSHSLQKVGEPWCLEVGLGAE